MKRLVRLLIVVTLALALVPVQPLNAGNEVQANDRIVMQYLDSLYHRRDVNGASVLLAENVVIHDPLGETLSAAQFAENNQAFLNYVQNIKITPYAVIHEDDMIVVPYLWEGALAPQKPEGIPQQVSGNAVDFFRISNDHIVEMWHRAEFHYFSLLTSSEDYRSTLNMSFPRKSLVESSGIPMLSDMIHQSTLSEQTGIPALAEVNLSFAANTAMTDEQLLLNWVDSYNQGIVEKTSLTPMFELHSCPCDGLGDHNLQTFLNQTKQTLQTGDIFAWTPIDHTRGWTMVSEGGLTALLYDVHSNQTETHPDAISIFRIENGLIAEEWSF